MPVPVELRTPDQGRLESTEMMVGQSEWPEAADVSELRWREATQGSFTILKVDFWVFQTHNVSRNEVNIGGASRASRGGLTCCERSHFPGGHAERSDYHLPPLGEDGCQVCFGITHDWGTQRKPANSGFILTLNKIRWRINQLLRLISPMQTNWFWQQG